MKGDLVLVRAFEGPAVGRVVEVAEDIVCICSVPEFRLLSDGQEAASPVGFRRFDVFEYDPKFAKDIARGKVDWKRLTPYKEGEAKG